MRSRTREWVWRLLGLVGIGFMGAVVWRDVRGGAVLEWPPWWSLVVAFVVVGAALFISSTAWLRVLATAGDHRLHRADFFAAQLGKYLPGGIWQPIGQVGLSGERGVSKLRTTASIVLHAGIQVAAGVLIGALLVFDPTLPIPIRVLAAGGFLVPFALIPTLRRMGRAPRIPISPEQVGQPSHVVRLLGLLLINLLLQGVAFSMVASVGVDGLLTSVVAFAVAWTVGFLAVPFPAGLGVREAILVALVPMPAATVVAASVVLRVVTIAAEFTLILVSRARA